MEAGKTPSSSSSEEDVSLIPPQHLLKKRAAEEEDDNSVSDVSLIPPQHLPKNGAEEEEYIVLLSSSFSEEDVSPQSPPSPIVGSTPAWTGKGPMKHKEEDCFIVKLSQNGEQDESIHKQEAVCRLCFKMLGEADSVLKTKCKCQFTLLHTICGDQWPAPKCNSCQQNILIVPVTISSSRPNSAKKPRYKMLKFEQKRIPGKWKRPKI